MKKAGQIFKAVEEDECAKVRAFLVKNPELIHALDVDLSTPLLMLAHSKEMITILLDCGARINAQNEHGRSLLHCLAFNESLLCEVMDMLLSRGADINIRDACEWTPLHVAADLVNIESVKCLVLHGANVNTTDKVGKTPLQVCLEDDWPGCVDVAKLLIDHGAEIISLDQAIAIGDMAWAEAFVKEDPARVNSLDSYGQTPLHWATNTVFYENCLDIADMLLYHGADIDSENAYGTNALHNASMFNSTKAIEFLIHRGADINAKSTSSGMTPLMFAVEEGHREAVEILLSSGADLNLEESSGRTALDMAQRKIKLWKGIGENYEQRQKSLENYRVIIEILRKHGTQ